MSERKTLLLRLDPAVHDALQRWASDELRSTNAQMEMLLRDALRRAGRLPSGVKPLRRPGRPPLRRTADEAPPGEGAESPLSDPRAPGDCVSEAKPVAEAAISGESTTDQRPGTEPPSRGQTTEPTAESPDHEV